MRCIGIDISKKTCEVCIIDKNGNVLERTSYVNTRANAAKCAMEMQKKYGKCRAVCESTGNMWIKTCDGFEGENIPTKVVNPYKMKGDYSQTPFIHPCAITSSDLCLAGSSF